MSNRRLLLWLVLGIALLAVVNLLLSRNGAARSETHQRVGLLDFPDDAVSMLVIRRAEDAAATVMTRAGEWRLIEPFSASVDEQLVFRLLDALAYSPVGDQLSDQELIHLGRTRADFGLLSPQVSVQVRAGERESVLRFGSLTPSSTGVYVALDGVNAVFVAPSNLLAAVDVPASYFRQRTLFSARADTISSFDIKRGGESFLRFVREGEVWKMVQPMESVASMTRIRKLLDLLVTAEALDFVWPVGLSNEVTAVSAALLSSYGLDSENAITISCKGLNGTDCQISLGGEAKDGSVYALVHGGAAIVTVNQILKEAASTEKELFADARVFPYEADQITGVSLSLAGANCLLARDEKGAWRMDAPVATAVAKEAMDDLLTRILALQSSDITAEGLTVSLSTGGKPVVVLPWKLGLDFRFENLCEKTMLTVDWAAVKRLTKAAAKADKPTAIAFDADRRVWNVETAAHPGVVARKAVEAVREVLSPLRASRVVALKVSSDDLRDYGLETPAFTIAIDFIREDSVRRNLMIGDKTREGYFATIGAADVVFVLPEKTVNVLTADWIEE